MTIENLSANKSFGGWHKQYSHQSLTLNCSMRFAIYLPSASIKWTKSTCVVLAFGLNLHR